MRLVDKIKWLQLHSCVEGADYFYNNSNFIIVSRFGSGFDEYHIANNWTRDNLREWMNY